MKAFAKKYPTLVSLEIIFIIFYFPALLFVIPNSVLTWVIFFLVSPAGYVGLIILFTLLVTAPFIFVLVVNTIIMLLMKENEIVDDVDALK